MQPKVFDINLDIIENFKNIPIEVIQGDYGTNVFNIKLTNRSNKYDLTGVSIEIAFQKFDTKIVVQDFTNGLRIVNEVDGLIECTLTTNTMSVEGKVNAELRILDGVKSITSKRFSFIVKTSLLNEEFVISTNEIPKLEKAIEDARIATGSTNQAIGNAILAAEEANTAKEAAITATSDVNTAKTNAFNAAEAAISAANSSNAAEILRVTAEGARLTSESTRKTSEDTRIASETSRKSNETARQAAEITRQVGYSNINNRIDNLVIGAGGNSPIEVTDARNSASKSKTFATLDSRLEETEDDVKAINNKIDKPDMSTPSDINFPYAFPPTVQKGNIASIAKGRNSENKIVNGDFSNGVANWGSAGGVSTLSNKIFTLTGDGTTALPQIFTAPSKDFILNNKFYGRAKFRIRGTGCTNVRFRFIAGYKDVNIVNPVADQWYTVNELITVGANITTQSISIMATYPDSATANGKQIEIDGNFGSYMVNLTDLGDTETDLNVLAIKYPFHVGIASSGMGCIKGTNKNVWGSKKSADDTVLKTGNNLYASLSSVDSRNVLVFTGNSIYLNTKYFSGFLPNTQYTFSAFGRNNQVSNGGYFVFSYTDGTTSVIAPVGQTWQKTTATSTLGKTIESIKASYGATGSVTYWDYDTIQLEIGTVATTYESYIDNNEAFCNVELRAISSLIKDEFYWDRFVKNVSDWTNVDGTYNWLHLDNQTGYKRVYISSNFKQDGISGVGILVKYNGASCQNIGNIWTSINATDQFSYYSTNPTLRLAISVSNTETGFTDALSPSANEIQAYFYGWKMCNSDGSAWDGVSTKYWKRITDGTGLTSILPVATYAGYTPYKMLYALGTPVEQRTTYFPSQIINSYSNGTIYWINAIKDEAKYATGITILNSKYPIKNLLKVTKVVATGDEKLTDIDIAITDCTVAGDGLSFTSTKLVAGDVVKYKYEYRDGISIPPIVNMSYVANMRGELDGLVDTTTRMGMAIDNLDGFVIVQLIDLATRMALEEARKCVAIADSVATDIAGLKADYNNLLAKMRTAKLIG